MLTSEIALHLDRPSRYLAQLCRHADAMGKTGGGHRPRPHAATAALARGDLRVHAEYSDTHGVITIDPWGQATLDATDDTLTLRVDAADEDALDRIQAIVTRDLERFGRRSGISVTWPSPRTSIGDPATADNTEAATTARRRYRNPILLALVVMVAVAVHLGLGAMITGKSRWAGLTVDVILAVVAGKLVLLTLGRRVLRSRHIPRLGTHLRARTRSHRPQ